MLLGLTGVSLLFRKVGVPALVGYILIGIVAAGAAAGDVLHVAGEIGIVLLFFVLGLQFNLKKMAEISRRVLYGGLLDVGLNFGIPLLVAYAFGLDWLSAAFVGGITYASSSSITLGLLTERHRLANPESEFMLALLVFEDIVAPVMISVLVALSVNGSFSPQMMLQIGASTVGIIGAAAALGHFLFARLGEFVEHNSEKDFVMLLIIGVAFALSGVAVVLGLSEVLGAFLAGVMLAETRETETLDRLVAPLRNLMLPFFFLYFGTQIELAAEFSVVMLVVLLLCSLIGKLAVGLWGGQWFGLSHKDSLRAGFSLVQRGEFSAVLATQATPNLAGLGGLYIITSALLGTVLFAQADRLAEIGYQLTRRFGNS